MDLHMLLELSPAWFTLQLLSPSERWEEEIPIFEICPENRKSVFFEEGSGYFEMHIMLVLLHIKRIFVWAIQGIRRMNKYSLQQWAR